MGAKGISPEPSTVVRERVLEARAMALARAQEASETLNARFSPASVRRHCTPDAHGLQLIEATAQKGRLSVRGLDRVLRVARTIADLEGVPRAERKLGWQRIGRLARSTAQEVVDSWQEPDFGRGMVQFPVGDGCVVDAQELGNISLLEPQVQAAFPYMIAESI